MFFIIYIDYKPDSYFGDKSKVNKEIRKKKIRMLIV